MTKEELREIRQKNRRGNMSIGVLGFITLFVGAVFYRPVVWLAAACALALLTNIATKNDDSLD